MENECQIIRVKRKANEERSAPPKKCKYVGSCESNDDQHVLKMVMNSQSDDNLKITDYDNLVAFDKHFDIEKCTQNGDTITCNGEALQRANGVNDFVYDIYVYDNNSFEYDDENEKEVYDDEEVSSNDENYAYNDYPEDGEVKEHNVSDYEDEDCDDYDDGNDGISDDERKLRRMFRNATIESSDDSDCDDYKSDANERNNYCDDSNDSEEY